MLVALASCVPEGPAARDEAQVTAPERRTAEGADPAGDPELPLAFRDDFERADLGKSWRVAGGGWRVEGGELCVRGAKNHGVWLRRRLPANARIRFDARADSADGDVKAELWGDGKSGATSASYSNATSYLVIFGGWENSRHVLARIDEHGDDRLSLEIDPRADDGRLKPAALGQRYRFRVERRDGKTIKWWVDDELMLELADREPLAGAGHDHFGFNDWTAPVCFDNLEITPW